MSFDFNDFNDVADLAGVLQRSQQQKSLNEHKELLRKQNELEKETQYQNAQILRHLKEQEQKEEAEKKRLASLPSCPDCTSPVEVGSRRCKHCHIEIVSWDYTEQGLSWRLICRAPEAGAKLQERSNFLVAEASRYKLLCIEICNRYDTQLIQRCCDCVATVSTIIARQKTQSSRDAMSQCIANAVNGKRVLPSADEAAFDTARQDILSRWQALNVHWNSEVKITKTQMNVDFDHTFAGASCYLIFLALCIWWYFIAGDLADHLQWGTARYVGLLVVGLACCSAPVAAIKQWIKSKAQNAFTAAQERLNKCNSVKDEEIAHLNSAIEAKASSYSEELAKAGISPFVEELLYVRESIVAAETDLRKYALELKRYYTAAVDLNSFAATCDNVSMTMLTRLNAVDACCAESNSKARDH